jgi:hypothetical protein
MDPHSSPGCYDARKAMTGILNRWKSTLAMVALLSAVLAAGTQESTGADPTRPAQSASMTCAGRDADLLILIDYLGEAPSFAGDRLFKLQLAIMHARDVCAQGRESTALSLYDRAVLDLVFHASLR